MKCSTPPSFPVAWPLDLPWPTEAFLVDSTGGNDGEESHISMLASEHAEVQRLQKVSYDHWAHEQGFGPAYDYKFSYNYKFSY